ncbi:hypothetical protein Scep_026760 [Stephania cephalantha]|uniref:Uncharacterized protein n=1 Tax=Stephania cephalantha TaxID=152367 RepID=A0AAP0EKU2_9MAGN
MRSQSTKCKENLNEFFIFVKNRHRMLSPNHSRPAHLPMFSMCTKHVHFMNKCVN